jgi:AcrR family transcriptional regulator
MATHEPPEVRRAQILEAALDCFGRKGLHAAKMDDIVESSGLSKGAIYWHFKSKDEIFLALFDRFEEELLAEWDAAPQTDAVQTLRRTGEIALTRLLAMRPLLEAWTEFLRHPKSRRRMAQIYRRTRARLAGAIRDGIASGQIGECDPDHVAGALTGLVEGLLLQAFADPDYDPLEVWPNAWKLVERGLTDRAKRPESAG